MNRRYPNCKSTFRRRLLLAMLAGIWCFLGGSMSTESNAQEKAVVESDLKLSEGTKAKIASKIEAFLNEKGVPGMSVAIGNRNQLVYGQGSGIADMENQVAVSTETRFRTASIAKSMTAVAIMSLVADGKIDLDAEVQDYCSDFPRKKWPLTVRQVMGHLSGIRHYKTADEPTSTEHFFSLQSALKTFADDRLRHEPGTKFLYSSFGYNLLGSVVEGASGQDFMTLLNDRVLKPAAMTETVADDTFAIIPHRTRGYIRPSQGLIDSLPKDHNVQAGNLYNSQLHDTSMKIPSGGLLSTASDLVRFASSVNEEKLIPRKLMDEMWQAQQTQSGSESGYGLGWRVGKQLGKRAVWHTGGQSGTSTVLMLFPESGVSVAIMCNLENTRVTGLASSLASDVFKE